MWPLGPGLHRSFLVLRSCRVVLVGGPDQTLGLDTDHTAGMASGRCQAMVFSSGKWG